MPEPDVVSYNTLISGFMHFGRYSEALKIFRRMQRLFNKSRIEIDKFTVIAISAACGGIADLCALRQIHGAVVSVGLDLNLIISNALIDAYGKCGDAETSRQIFERMEIRDVFSWTCMVTVYAICGELPKAHRVFDRMPNTNSISWSALIAGYAREGKWESVLSLFMAMIEEGLAPTAFTLVSALGACSRAALLGRGRQIHGYIMRRSPGGECYNGNPFIQNSLIDMYAKCGNMRSASKLFERMRERDVVSWNSMVTGFARDGDRERSMGSIKEMIRSGVAPNNVTLLAALSACSHTGVLAEAPHLLDLIREHGLYPQPEHYAAVADLLGRSCCLKEASELTTIASQVDSALSWDAILGACCVHGNLALAKTASEALFVLEPCNAGRYVTLCNIYSSAGKWEESRKLRKLMKEKGFKKEPARSWIELQGIKHAFLAEDTSHCQTEDIYSTLAFLFNYSKEPMDSV